MENEKGRVPQPNEPSIGQGPTADQSNRRSCGGRCCLWGCAGLTAVALVLIAGLVLLYLSFGKPWLDEKKTEILTRFPALSFALERASLPTNLEPLRDGSTARDAFPQDIYIPEGLISAAYRSSDTGAVARLRLEVTTDLPSLAASYRREMVRLGWTRVPVPDPREGIRLNFRRPGSVVRVLLRRGPDAVSVWIHRRPVE